MRRQAYVYIHMHTYICITHTHTYTYIQVCAEIVAMRRQAYDQSGCCRRLLALTLEWRGLRVKRHKSVNWNFGRVNGVADGCASGVAAFIDEVLQAFWALVVMTKSWYVYVCMHM